MKKILTLVIFVAVIKPAFSQNQKEEVSPLTFNPALYYSAQKNNPSSGNQYKYLVTGGNTVVSQVATLQLPFVDDFSRNREPNYLWAPTHTIDSFFNVVGVCLANEGITTTQAAFMTIPSYTYYWDIYNQQLDSTPQQPIRFTFFGTAPSGCLSGSPSYSELFWPTYYTYIFDSANGYAIDSIPVIDPDNTDTITYAPVVYFTIAESGTLWFDDYAYINNTYPINPPTIGVATLDGLNQYGLPYNNATGVGGQADYLTSNPINLAGLSVSDSVYLSFFFEPQGLGDWPDVGDSLVLEFLDYGGIWNIVWYDTGYSDATTVPDTFQQILIQVPQYSTFPTTYYDSAFQFRFRNIVSDYGLNNHWHIDYVRLDKNRSIYDTAIHDDAFIYPFPTILKYYTQEPGTQFNYPSDLVDSIVLPIRNLDPNAYTNPPATNFNVSANELYPTPQVVQSPLVQAFDAGPYDAIQLNPQSQYQNLPDGPIDSLVIQSLVFLVPNGSDNLLLNDTLYHTQTLTSVMAYDDGSAEKAYGLIGGGTDLKKFAYEFILNRPDTLFAFQVMFTQAEANVKNLIFNYAAWDTLRLNDDTFTDVPIYSLVNQAPFYIDSTNGFCTYLLNTPMIISGKFYFGWEQDDDRRLQVGYDMNSQLGYPHIRVYLNGVWDTSTIPQIGSPMIRLIFSANWWGGNSQPPPPTAVIDLTKGKDMFRVFPNPTAGVVYLQGNAIGAAYSVNVFNAIGQSVAYYPSVTSQINLSNLTNGMYILQSQDLVTGKTYRNKIIKTSF